MNFDPLEIVLDLVIRRLRLKEWQYDVEDWAEDIGEGLRHIGAVKVYEQKIAELEVNNYSARIPKDCINIMHLDPMNKPYIESGSFIQTDDPDGTIIKLVYQAMPVDVRGYPLVPDSTAVREALMWYCIKWMALRGEVKNVSFASADQEWQWSCGSAQAELNIMSLIRWNGVANDYTRLNPIKDAFANNLTEVGKDNNGLRRDRRSNRY